ncbi:SIMPL domain-containing protein [uncultured Pseudoalteromonas sp.]|uniref:SIMPL domain-containing protein n=1 Tax=uncultured Pseudoalteromonas sp. TaxID=114053 RepID=UPI002594B1B3|nr:SIMPL domain-containing protein [uncultured Pseudoalteromonas sp.]
MKLIIAIFITLFPLITFANSSVPANRHIAVQGSAEIFVEPDMAQIIFEVKSTEDTFLEAKRELDDRISLLLEQSDKYGFGQNDVYISGLKSKVYTMIGTESGTVSGDKYLALKIVKVTLKDIKKVDEFINFAQSLKIDNIEKINGLSSKVNQLEAEATQLAIDNAKAKGNKLAQAFGAELGNVYSISANSSSSDYDASGVKHIVLSSHRNSMAARNNENPFTQQQYLGARISVKASINVVFDLKLK